MNPEIKEKIENSEQFAKLIDDFLISKNLTLIATVDLLSSFYVNLLGQVISQYFAKEEYDEVIEDYVSKFRELLIFLTKIKEANGK